MRRLGQQPPAPEESCRLVGGLFEVFVQTFLLISALASLWAKRRCERPKRVRVVWLCDVAKQCVGGSFVHVANMVASAWIAGRNAGGDPCAFYFINFFADCTLGCAVVALVHGATRKFVRKLARGAKTDLDVIGDYGSPPRKRVWESNLQPDFNVRVCDRFDARLSAVLRELDESNRFVQESAESTSIESSEVWSGPPQTSG